MYESWLGGQMGRRRDCAACARHAEGAEAAALRQDERALEIWAPVLEGDLLCDHQPQGVLGASLLVLLRRDELGQAVHAHEYGYRVSRRKPAFRGAIGEHLEFCALTGNEHRGLELLAEHADWLTEPAPGIAAQAEFLTGASVLLARLVALGHSELPVPMPPSPGAHVPAGEELTVTVLRGFVDAELESLAARIARAEAEEGVAPGYAARLRIRRLRQPAPGRLPLPVRSTLREPAAAPPPYAEPAAAHLEVPGTGDLYALSDTLFQAGELDEVEPALQQVVDRSMDAGAPWYAARAEMNLSRLVSDSRQAVRLARAAVMDCVDARLRGPAALTLATALWELDGREAEAIEPALEAAEIYTAEDRGAEAALARLRAADALAFTGRRRASVGLYQRSFAQLDDESFWDPEEYGATLARHQMQYVRALLALGAQDEGVAVLERLRARLEHWPDDTILFEMTVGAAYALRDAELPGPAADAFLRAARLAGQDPERLLVRIRCLRSAAWLEFRAGRDDGTDLMDEAGTALVRRLDGEPDASRRDALRLELAETHFQRAELTADSDPVLAEQDAAAALSGMRRVLGAGGGGRTAAEDLLGLYGRIADCSLLLGRIEIARHGATGRAERRLRELVAELEAAAPEGFADLVKTLTEQADRFAREEER